MKNKGIVVAVAALAVILAVIFIVRPFAYKEKASVKTAVPGKSEKQKAVTTAPEKRTFTKGMGGLTVKIKGSGDKPLRLKIRAFSADGNNSSVFANTFTSERMQELASGTYDIEIETTPVKIYKNIAVREGKETVHDLGAVTGALNIKALNSKKKEAMILTKVTSPKTNTVATVMMTNKSAEIVPGVYNIEIGTNPKQVKNDVKIEAGRETLLDLGAVSGAIMVKAVTEEKKEVGLPVYVKNPANGSMVAATIAGRSVEVGPGEYDIDILSVPPQNKKGVKVSAGEESAVEFTIQAPAPAKAPAPKKK